MRRRGGIIAAVAAAAVVVAVGLGLVLSRPGSPPDAGGQSPSNADGAAPGQQPAPEPWDATTAGEAFLTDYVQADGRVVRSDQGGDTVSEGQAYAMLIAVGARDAETFEAVWSWTQENLQRPDALLSWRWADGAVVDPEPASDADLDAARALALAGEEFDEPAYTADARALAAAVLDLETVQTDLGRVLTAGPWATASSPHAINPSYPAPAATAVLAQVLPDPRWAELDEGSRAANAELMAGPTLPPDWAQVHSDGRIEPMPGAQGGGSDVRYGYDAARTFVRFAESCEPADQELAAQAAGLLEQREVLPAELDLGGAPLAEGDHPVGYAGRAAARAVSGDVDGALADLRAADAAQQASPSYFGGAWAALGRLSLQTERLGGCPPLEETGAQPATADGEPAAADGEPVTADGEPVTADGESASSAGSEAASSLSQGAGEDTAGDGSLALSDPDPDAPVGPQPIPDAGDVPVRVQIPDIGVDSSLEHLVRDAQGVLEPPVVPEQAGWFAGGTVPGERGPAVIAGHVDSGVAGAVFQDLEELRPGAEILVEMSDGEVHTFRMDRADVVQQAQFPSTEVYGPVPDRQLRLITCHTFDPDHRDYVDNLVVFATAEEEMRTS